MGASGKNLRLEAAAAVDAIGAPAEAGTVSVHHVDAVVELNAGLGRGDGQGDAVLRRGQAGGRARRGGALRATTQFSRRRRGCRRASGGSAAARGNRNRMPATGDESRRSGSGRVGRRVGIGEDLDDVIEDVGRIVEVEVGVLREVDEGGRVGGGGRRPCGSCPAPRWGSARSPRRCRGSLPRHQGW